jgi:hypothetical protein
MVDDRTEHPDARAVHPLGLALFAVYSASYAVYVGVAAFGTFRDGVPDGGLASTAFAGLNWGVVGGMGLIAGAFALALLYAIVRIRRERATAGRETR